MLNVLDYVCMYVRYNFFDNSCILEVLTFLVTQVSWGVVFQLYYLYCADNLFYKYISSPIYYGSFLAPYSAWLLCRGLTLTPSRFLNTWVWVYIVQRLLTTWCVGVTPLVHGGLSRSFLSNLMDPTIFLILS